MGVERRGRPARVRLLVRRRRRPGRYAADPTPPSTACRMCHRRRAPANSAWPASGRSCSIRPASSSSPPSSAASTPAWSRCPRTRRGRIARRPGSGRSRRTPARGRSSRRPASWPTPSALGGGRARIVRPSCRGSRPTPWVMIFADGWRRPGPAADSDVAFLQYTSGSTATPKGVMVTHGNLLANSSQIRDCFGSTPESRGVFWLPLFHDMGLIGGVLQTIYCGGSSTLLSPVAFLQRPIRWLQAISETRATISGGPNFAYDLCVRKDRARAARRPRPEPLGSRLQRAPRPILARRPSTASPRRSRRVRLPLLREAFLPCYGHGRIHLARLGRALRTRGRQCSPEEPPSLGQDRRRRNRHRPTSLGAIVGSKGALARRESATSRSSTR